MKFTVISDTHGQHNNLALSAGDVLIHAGDVSKSGTEEQVVDFLEWFESQPFRYKIFIAGNHDFYFERRPDKVIKKIIPSNVVYLNDNYVMVDSIKIWGSPVQPWFHNWAFNRHRGKEIKHHWDLIPNDVSILITHGPAYGILDVTDENLHVGCEELTKAIERINPKIHIVGHIHEAYGQQLHNGTMYYNACVLNKAYRMVNAPWQFEL